MNAFFLSGVFTLLIGASTIFAQEIYLKPGKYDAWLQLSQTKLPVRLTVELQQKQHILVVHNAEERLELRLGKQEGDTFIFPFPNFDSELRVVTVKRKQIRGFWVSYDKGPNYRIPFEATLAKKSTTVQPSVNMTGNWETYFTPGTENQEAAVGIFKQKNNIITGTFLTNTGDYRFLEGTVQGEKLQLSSFDGSHALLLTGTVTGDSIQGNFFSGKNYQATWRSVKNAGFHLENSDSLTFLTDATSKIHFTLNDINGNSYTYPNEQMNGKVVIIQIMGTWCANCMDETKYYKELYNRYHTKGLEVIAIGYENATTPVEQAAKIRHFKDRNQLDFIFLVGGKASKELASQQFSMLNGIMSFPTTILIGKDGTVERIHTGFSGPGTGKHYTDYVEKTTALIEALVAK